ncbi:MAG TPA: NAGSA dehydrogenase family protein [Streptosporangiaceae bacterium]|jgi:N-acetyl-gamma-glutamyl-phosphate reductase
MGARVAVAGASGYAGGELLRLLAGHPDLELGAITAGGSAGKTVGEVHPHLAGAAGLAGQVFEPHDPARLAGCDLVFLALPAGESAAVAASLPDAVKAVDLGPDFRLADPGAWARHYRGEHPGRWVTGLPELPGLRAQISAASRVAAPGCYATAAILALVPLAAAGLVSARDVVVVAASGTSGAGRSLRADLLGSEVMGSVSAYQAGGAHRHTAEIEQALREFSAPAGAAGGQPGDKPGADRAADGAGGATGTDGAGGTHGAGGTEPSVSFTPVLAPMPRGILATCTARLSRAGTGTAELRAALAAAYPGGGFACVLPEGRWPATASVAGSNGAHLQAAADSRAGRAVVVAAIDNLGKGAAGQAIQNANLMLGLPEAAGLTVSGVAP